MKKEIDITRFQVVVVPESKIQCGQIERNIKYVIDAFALIFLI